VNFLIVLVAKWPVAFWSFAKMHAGFPVSPTVRFAGFVLNDFLSNRIAVVTITVLLGNATAAADQAKEYKYGDGKKML